MSIFNIYASILTKLFALSPVIIFVRCPMSSFVYISLVPSFSFLSKSMFSGDMTLSEYHFASCFPHGIAHNMAQIFLFNPVLGSSSIKQSKVPVLQADLAAQGSLLGPRLPHLRQIAQSVRRTKSCFHRRCLSYSRWLPRR